MEEERIRAVLRKFLSSLYATIADMTPLAILPKYPEVLKGHFSPKCALLFQSTASLQEWKWRSQVTKYDQA